MDAFGRRKKRQATERNSLALEGFQEGALREEIMVQSNAILTFEKKENQVALPTEGNDACFFLLNFVIGMSWENMQSALDY